MQRATKKRVFEEACLAFQMSGIPHTQAFEALYARERLGNNSLGAGVCLPHCEIEDLKRPFITIVLLQRPIHIDLTAIGHGKELKAWWYDPRNGSSFPIGNVKKCKSYVFTPLTEGAGNDWVLVLDDPDAGYPAPGTTIVKE